MNMVLCIKDTHRYNTREEELWKSLVPEWKVQLIGSYEDEDEYELSVIWSEYDLGQQSCGWSSQAKFILFEDRTESEGPSIKEQEYMNNIAQIFCEQLNLHHVVPLGFEE